MEKRFLGQNKLEVSALGLGCMGMSDAYGIFDDQESIKTINRALELGVTFFDTADVYGMGRNELLLGKALGRKRKNVIIATKFGNIRDNNGRYIGVNGNPEYVLKACDESLIRLDVDYIDLYYLHRVDRNTPIEETVDAMAKLVRQGKVLHLGLSEASAETIKRAYKIHPIAALQTEYSIWSRDVEENILPTCRELGVGFVAYSPLGRGFLTGTIKNIQDLAPNDSRIKFNYPRFSPVNFDKNLRALAIVEKIALRNDCSATQVALAWLLAQGSDIVPIPGTKRRTFLEENINAVPVSLSKENMSELADIVGLTAGERYSEAAMRNINL